MVRTEVQLTEAQAAALRGRAAREGVSRAELIRRSLDLLLFVSEPSAEPDARRRAAAAVGFLDQGPSDLAEEHDAYFAEAASERLR